MYYKKSDSVRHVAKTFKLLMAINSGVAKFAGKSINEIDFKIETDEPVVEDDEVTLESHEDQEDEMELTYSIMHASMPLWQLCKKFAWRIMRYPSVTVPNDTVQFDQVFLIFDL